MYQAGLVSVTPKLHVLCPAFPTWAMFTTFTSKANRAIADVVRSYLREAVEAVLVRLALQERFRKACSAARRPPRFVLADPCVSSAKQSIPESNVGLTNRNSWLPFYVHLSQRKRCSETAVGQEFHDASLLIKMGSWRKIVISQGCCRSTRFTHHDI